MIKFYLALIISFLFFSCEEKKKEEKNNDQIVELIHDHTGIIIPNYTLINTESSSAFGDFAQSFLIKFDSIEFQILVDKILKTPDYSDKIVTPTSENVNNNPALRWQKYESGYKYEIYISDNNEHINFYVNTLNKTLYYMSIEE